MYFDCQSGCKLISGSSINSKQLSFSIGISPRNVDNIHNSPELALVKLNLFPFFLYTTISYPVIISILRKILIILYVSYCSEYIESFCEISKGEK